MLTSLAFKARFSRVHYEWVIVAVSFVTAVIIASTLGISGVLLFLSKGTSVGNHQIFPRLSASVWHFTGFLVPFPLP